MNENKNEVTADHIVIEQYAIEAANLRLQNAQLRLKVNEMVEELEAIKESEVEADKEA